MKTLFTLFFIFCFLFVKGDYWTRKADFGGTGRAIAFSFSIGTKGYVGCGWDSTLMGLRDFWEYDPSNNSWSQKADFGGTGRIAAISFSILGKGYAGMGDDGTNLLQDLWEYD